MQGDLFPSKKRRGYIRIPRDVPLIVCNGVGVNSYAQLIALKRKGIIPTVITFADLEAEKPETCEALAIIDDWLVELPMLESIPGISGRTLRKRF